jgi:hypothetical protein
MLPPTLPELDALLAALGISPDAVARAEPLAGGLSGSRVVRLTLGRLMPGGATAYASRIIKEVHPRDGWLGILSDDRCMREIALHERQILSDRLHLVATATEGWARQGAVTDPTGSQWGAVLLGDERGHLLRHPLRTPPGRMPPAIAFILDRLAWLHAHFWEDTRLRASALGLTSARDTLLLYAPQRIAERIAAGDPATYLPLAAAGWEAFFRLASPAAAAALHGVLAAPEQWVKAIADLPATLVHGDVWGPNIGILPPTRATPRIGRRLLLLDWALATSGPATYDPLSLCGAWHALDPVRLLALYRARLTRHLAARGLGLSQETWQALADMGYLRTALTCGEAFGRAAALAPAGAMRRRAVARLEWWARRGALAARRRGAPPVRRG